MEPGSSHLYPRKVSGMDEVRRKANAAMMVIAANWDTGDDGPSLSSLHAGMRLGGGR